MMGSMDDSTDDNSSGQKGEDHGAGAGHHGQCVIAYTDESLSVYLRMEQSICSVSGAPGLQIPGYQGSNNVENMPTVNDDDSKKNATNATQSSGTTPPASGSQDGGATSTLIMPASVQTPPSNGAQKSPGTGSSVTTGSTSGAERVGGVVAAVTAAAMLASVGIWTLF
ncbi:hypothetical protein NDA16_002812 [Ustilago loliicola]|nr:hypothetical protein NDA16_002812 [Ustilago loliicola]